MILTGLQLYLGYVLGSILISIGAIVLLFLGCVFLARVSKQYG